MNLPQILSLLWLLVVLIAFAMNSLSTRSKSTPLLQIQKCSTIVVMAGLFAFTLLVQFIVSKVHGPAVPVTNDEFCYLLAGENYSQGKLTSPPPPYLKPFQSSGYLLNHAYYPKYQPAQGISLAIGIILGKPIYGVWLILSLGIALAYWALQGFFTKSTAFQAAFLLSTHPLVLLWGESFMGGGVPFLGGTLFWGGWIHFYYKNPNIKNAILSGIGLMILLFCRPFEGLVLLAVIIFSCLLLFRFQPLRFTLHRAFYFLGILSLFVFLILLLQSFFNLKTTGNIFLPPYIEYEKLYGLYDPFLWNTRKEIVPDYPNLMFQFAFFNLDTFYSVDSFQKLILLLQDHFFTFFYKYFSLPLIVLSLFAFKNKLPFKIKLILLWIFLSIASSFCVRWYFEHYSAPILILFGIFYSYLLISFDRWRKQTFLFSRKVIPAIITSIVLFHLLFHLVKNPFNIENQWAKERINIIRYLEEVGGQHLILVQYTEKIFYSPELPADWVHNRSDFINSKVLWAFDLSADESKKIVELYPSRKIWHLKVESRNQYSLKPWNP